MSGSQPVQDKGVKEFGGVRSRAMLSVQRPGIMKKRSVIINGHRTSVSLENVFWSALKALATQHGMTVNQLVTEIDRERNGNLSSAIRVFVLLSHCLNNDEPRGLTTQPLQ